MKISGCCTSVRRILTAGIVLLVPGMFVGCGGGASVVPRIVLRPVETRTDKADGGADVKAADGGSNTAATAGDVVGTIRGKFVLDGQAPKLPPLVIKGTAKKDGEVCGALADIPNEELIVDSSGGIANVFIYLDRKPSWQFQLPSETAAFDQKGCVFLTHASVVPVGVPIQVLNSDPIPHNTHTFPTRNTPFNQLLKENDREGVPLVFPRAETTPVEIKCDLHAWMRAFMLPLDHPYGTVSKHDGTFEISGLPAGTHKFKIWHERASGNGFLNRAFSVEVSKEMNELGEIKFSPSAFGVGN